VPELPEVESVRRRLQPAMARRRFERVIVRRPDLRTPFPRRFAARITGTTALAVQRRAKYLVVPLSSGETLLMHLGMSGWFEVGRDRVELNRHDHVVFHMSSGAIVTFNDTRRFGFIFKSLATRVNGTVGLQSMELKTLLARILEDVLSGAISAETAVQSLIEIGDTNDNDLVDGVFHELIHYREDQDIRSIDQRYAEAQQARLMALVSRLRK
jgi:formamidopyrimidine-DNA glycosylase